MRVLLTRPLKEAQLSAQKLIALGFTPVIAPVFEHVPLAPLLPKTQAVIVTSPRAMHLLVEKNLPVFKLDTTAEALAAEIAASPFIDFLWLTSEKRAFDLVAALPQKNIMLIEAYAMRQLSPALAGVKADAALHYSREAAIRTLHLLGTDALMPHYALSRRIASVFPPHCLCKIAAEPNETALFRLLEEEKCPKPQ
jgi:uroporphyrinogen-III synthase